MYSRGSHNLRIAEEIVAKLKETRAYGHYLTQEGAAALIDSALNGKIDAKEITYSEWDLPNLNKEGVTRQTRVWFSIRNTKTGDRADISKNDDEIHVGRIKAGLDTIYPREYFVYGVKGERQERKVFQTRREGEKWEKEGREELRKNTSYFVVLPRAIEVGDTVHPTEYTGKLREVISIDANNKATVKNSPLIYDERLRMKRETGTIDIRGYVPVIQECDMSETMRATYKAQQAAKRTYTVAENRSLELQRQYCDKHGLGFPHNDALIEMQFDVKCDVWNKREKARKAIIEWLEVVKPGLSEETDLTEWDEHR